jgi:hypothetical protein
MYTPFWFSYRTGFLFSEQDTEIITTNNQLQKSSALSFMSITLSWANVKFIFIQKQLKNSK